MRYFTLHHTRSRRIIPYHILSYGIVLIHITLHYMSLYHNRTCGVASHYAASCCSTMCYIALYYTMLYYAMRCATMQHYNVLYYIRPCHKISYSMTIKHIICGYIRTYSMLCDSALIMLCIVLCGFPFHFAIVHVNRLHHIVHGHATLYQVILYSTILCYSIL